MAEVFTSDGSDTLIRIKAVPGASRDSLAGLLGDRLKIRITAAPEDGKANKAICRLLRAAIGSVVGIESGHGSPFKTVRVSDAGPKQVAETLGSAR